MTTPHARAGAQGLHDDRGDALEDGARAWREAVAEVIGRAADRVEASPAPRPIRLAMVLPCYNEEAVLPETIERLAALRARLVSLQLIVADSPVYLVDDGSRDATWALIEAAARIFPWAHGLKLSRNRGHQNALLAGLLTAEGDAVVSLDADLQDDLDAVVDMVRAHAAGAEIVYGVRSDRTSDSRAKRWTAEGYYRLLRWCGVDVVFNHADYRLMGRRALSTLAEFGEVNLFLRGMIPLLGFQSAVVEYARGERFAGTSKYPLRKMLALAWNGITSLSAAPLHWVTALGTLVSLLSFVLAAWALVLRLFAPSHVVVGWASTVVPLIFLGGVQLLAVGIIGEYVGKLYLEVKRRPRFVIERRV